MKAFVEFYSKEGISPVSQDITDLKRHFRRRAALYRHLGVVPALVEGKRALEFGPGSGHNALFTASLEPESYVLVEGNPVGKQRTEGLLEEYFPERDFEVLECLIEHYEDDRKYELVLCEGLLPLQEDPAGIIRHVAGFLAPGGCLVITCTDSVTYLSELLRRLFSLVLTRPEQSTDEKIAILMPVFSPQLARIEGMSRPHDEYILDNIIQPFSGRRLFGVDEAIDAVSGLLTAYGTSPQYVRDWRWYKKITGPTAQFNDLHREAYRHDQHNFMDSRTPPVERAAEENAELASRCLTIYNAILAYEDSRNDTELATIEDQLAAVELDTRKWSPKTADSIRNYLNNFTKARKGQSDFDWTDFSDWFGQAQVYVSFLNDFSNDA